MVFADLERVFWFGSTAAPSTHSQKIIANQQKSQEIWATKRPIEGRQNKESWENRRKIKIRGNNVRQKG